MCINSCAVQGSTVIYNTWSNSFVFVFVFVFWPHCVACGILLPPPGFGPGPSAVKAQSPNPWTAREFPIVFQIKETSKDWLIHADSSAFGAHRYTNLCVLKGSQRT